VTDIDSKDTYLLIALDERKAYPGGSIVVEINTDGDNPERLLRLWQAGLIEGVTLYPGRLESWRLTKAGVAFLENVEHDMAGRY
jgi:hypothetical protein